MQNGKAVYNKFDNKSLINFGTAILLVLPTLIMHRQGNTLNFSLANNEVKWTFCYFQNV